MSIVTLNNRALKDATAVGTTTGLGDLVFISRSTASSSSTIDFTSGIDSTYKEYIFIFNNIHAATAGTDFGFQGDTGTNTNYNQTITSTFFRAAHNEADSTTAFSYDTGYDQAQGTSIQPIATNMGDDNDMSGSGVLHLFDPSNTTFVKHFIARSNVYQESVFNNNQYIAGYFNTTSAITRIQFKMASGNIDSGTIDLYGVN
tara:strand:+ start:466 stop:1071 length:606 start_codon:yes stop_codon:yes gene_type:complete